MGFLVLVFVPLVSFAETKVFPSAQVRRDMVLDLARHMERIDGDGLIPRHNRPESWSQTMGRLSQEAMDAQNLFELGRVFRRLDATYPNLHANIFMIREMEEKQSQGSVVFPFTILPFKVDRFFQNADFRIRVSQGATTDFKNGDRVLAINSRSIEEWSDENFLFCKFPLREQCELEFFKNFANELLSWQRSQSLEITVSRGGEVLSFKVMPQIKKTFGKKQNSETCEVPPSRYKDFSLVYKGVHLCAYEAANDTSNVALRLGSFYYEDADYDAVSLEVENFWKKYWQKKAPSVRRLVIDVMDNHGGQSPAPYYGLFYSQPYQEMYVQFKKIEEFESKDILQSLFWGDGGKELWFKNIKKDGSFAQTALGEFFPPIPQFCVSDKKDCRQGLFPAKNNQFTGEVRLLINHWCVSSCVGFVWNMKDLLKERVKTFGLPDSGDSAYSRLAVLVSPLVNQAKTQVAAMDKAYSPDEPEPWVRQVAAVTRSTDKNGNILSGKPLPIDVWVPKLWDQSDSEWATEVFEQATR